MYFKEKFYVTPLSNTPIHINNKDNKVEIQNSVEIRYLFILFSISGQLLSAPRECSISAVSEIIVIIVIGAQSLYVPPDALRYGHKERDRI